MKRANLQTRIIEALQADAKNGGSGLSVPEIAKEIYGFGYIKKTACELEKTIRQRMGIVVEEATNMGLTIFAKRKSCNPKTPEIKSRIALWKIFNPDIIGMKEELIDELFYKKRNGEARTSKFIQMLSVAKEFGAISDEKLKELTA